MKRKLLELLVCPICKGSLTASSETDPLVEGELGCTECGRSVPVINGIPRFVEDDNYASSFGYQWNLFRKEQIDTFNGTTLSADRFWSETDWTEEQMSGKWVLDAGCGAGRFLDIASRTKGEIVGVDLSNAIDAAKENLADRENVHFVQASIYELPFQDGSFDYCYSIGVIQHTPDRERALRSLAAKVKAGGQLAVTIYPRKPWTRLYSKYWLRPVTKRMKKETLLGLIRGAMPVVFPVTDVLFRVPVLKKLFMFAIPVANYVHEKQLTREQRYNWAILDTFDMLSPQFDRPMSEDEARRPLEESGLVVRRTFDHGLCLAGERTTE